MSVGEANEPSPLTERTSFAHNQSIIRVRANSIWAAITESIGRTFVAHIPLYSLAALFFLCTAALAAIYQFSLPFQASYAFLLLLPNFLLITIASALAYKLIFLIRHNVSGNRLRISIEWLAEQAITGDRPGNVFHSTVTLMPLMITFAALKEVIPQINPFSWDHTFMMWDRFVFGRDPWLLLQPIFGYAPITAGINFIYDFWFLIMFGCLFWQAYSPHSNTLRMQFLIAFSFAWFLGGNVLATIFSSAGPCFYGYLYPDANPYAQQMAYLHDVAKHWPVWSVEVQNALWKSYVTGDGVISGISAMPSMHVAITTIIAFLAWRTSKVFGWILIVFAGIVLIGSVHLAWHYALDSLAAVILGALFWWLAGGIARAWNNFQLASRQTDSLQ